MSSLRDRRHLAGLLKEELDFYRQLFVLMDRQCDRLRTDQEQQLVEDFEQIRDIRGRLEESEDLIARARSSQEQAFDDWARTPEIMDLQKKIAQLVGQCHKAAVECERLAQDQLAAYRTELAQMGQGRRLLASLSMAGDGPRYIDQRP